LRIRVEIDQLVLYGFNNNNKHEADYIDQDIKKELAQLIAKDVTKNKVMKSRGSEIDRIDGRSFNLGSGQTISKLASASIARSIYQSIRRI
jgi:hypothetical protein